MAEVCSKSPELGGVILSLVPWPGERPHQVSFFIPYLMYKMAVGNLFLVAGLYHTC